MRTRTIVISTMYYIAVAALLLGTLVQFWHRVLPAGPAARIGNNTEGYVAALAIAAWIQFVRPRLRDRRSEWPITILAALGFVALTVVLLTAGWPSRFRTLNEGTAAVALFLPYVQLRRPLPKRFAAVATIVAIAITVGTNRTAVTTNGAEAFGMVFLGIPAFDLVDRGILDPDATTRRAIRWIWYAFLVAAPTTFSLIEYHTGVGSTGPVGEPMRWLVRITEAFIFAFFVEIFFAVGLGRTGATGSTTGEDRTEPVTAQPLANV